MFRSLLLLSVLAMAHSSLASAASSSSTSAAASTACTAWNYTMTHIRTMPDTLLLTSPTNLPPSDDAVNQVDLPFNFTFYGESYTSMQVSTNGNIQFESTSIAWVDSAFPINLHTPTSQQPIIALYYVDLNPDQPWMQQTATIGRIGNRQSIVRYTAVPVCPFDQSATHNDTANDTAVIDSQPAVTCDVVLYEVDSHIEIRYYSVDPTPWPVDVGVQGSGVDQWTAAVDNQPMTDTLVQWLANSTLTFTPVCLRYETVTAPVGSGMSTGGTISTGSTVSTGSTLTTSTTVPVGGTAPAGGAPVNGASLSNNGIGLLVASLLLIALQSLLLL